MSRSPRIGPIFLLREALDVGPALMRVLVLGAGGMLGRELCRLAPAAVEVVPLARSQLDIVDTVATAEALDAHRPALVVNAAGYTKVDAAETEYAAALDVNGRAVADMALACAARSITLVHFGSDYVFSGHERRPYAETDVTSPLNAYGRSKLAGDQAVKDHARDYLLIRTQWLFGLHGPSFPRTMWNRASRRTPTRVVNDQFGRPTSAADVAGIVWDLITARERGVFHVANSGVATWHDVAEQIFAAAGCPELLTPCSSAEYPTAAVRPAYSVLDTTAVETRLGRPMPPWKPALERFLVQLRQGITVAPG